jgi:hypothetical protein
MTPFVKVCSITLPFCVIGILPLAAKRLAACLHLSRVFEAVELFHLLRKLIQEVFLYLPYQIVDSSPPPMPLPLLSRKSRWQLALELHVSGRAEPRSWIQKRYLTNLA